MANTKISQLPSYTGSAADLRWFVMNNSGETETFKYSGYSSQLIPGTGADSYRTPTQTAAGTNSIAIGKGAAASGDDSISIGDISYSIPSSAGTRSVVIGKHAQVVGDYQVVIGSAAYAVGSQAIAIGTDTAAYAAGAIVMGSFSRATAQHGITIGNNNDRNIGEFSTIIGYNNRIAEAPNYYGGIYNNIISSNSWINNSVNGIGYNTIIGGYGNYITGTTSGTTLIGLRNFTASAENDITYVDKLKSVGKNVEITDGTNTTSNIIGNLIIGKNNTLSQDKYNIVMGESNNLSGVGAPGVQGSIVNGLGNQLGTYAYGCLVFGGYNNTQQSGNLRFGNNGTTTGNNNLSGGEQNVVEGAGCITWGDYNNLKANYQQSFGNNNDITSTAAYQGIYGGQNNLISSPDGFNFMLGGSGNTISGGTFVSMIGTSGRTGTASATTYVENLHIYRTPSTEVQPIVSGTTFTANLELGAKSQFYLTGASTINITNVRDGASFMIKTQTDGTHSLTWTSPGYTFLFSDGGPNPGNNTIDIFVFEVFGSVIYGSRRHNFN